MAHAPMRKKGKDRLFTVRERPSLIVQLKYVVVLTRMVDRGWELRFHNRCGKYINFSDDNQRARRNGDTYDHGLVFSDRPLHLGELFQLKVEEMESKWAGSLVKFLHKL